MRSKGCVECGGNRSATLLWTWIHNRALENSGVAASLCHRSPKHWLPDCFSARSNLPHLKLHPERLARARKNTSALGRIEVLLIRLVPEKSEPCRGWSV